MSTTPPSPKSPLESLGNILSIIAIIIGAFGWVYARGGKDDTQAYVVNQSSTSLTQISDKLTSVESRVANLEAEFRALARNDQQQNDGIKALQGQQLEQLKMLERVNANTNFIIEFMQKKG